MELAETYSEEALAQERKMEQFTRLLAECVSWHQAPSELKTATLRHDLEGFMADNGSKSLDKALSLHRLDIRFSDWLSAQAAHRSDMEVMDNAIRLRNEVAHGTIEQRVTERDARRYRVVISRLVQKPDEYVAGNAATTGVSTTTIEGAASENVPTITSTPPETGPAILPGVSPLGRSEVF